MDEVCDEPINRPNRLAPTIGNIASEARCEIRPSLPTTCPMRSSSRASRWFVPITSLNVSAIFPPFQSSHPAGRTEKSPRLNAASAVSSCFWSSRSPSRRGFFSVA